MHLLFLCKYLVSLLTILITLPRLRVAVVPNGVFLYADNLLRVHNWLKIKLDYVAGLLSPSSVLSGLKSSGVVCEVVEVSGTLANFEACDSEEAAWDFEEATFLS